MREFDIFGLRLRDLGLEPVSVFFNPILGDNHEVDVTTRAHVIVDTGQNPPLDELHGFFLCHVFFELGFKDRHRCQGTGAHGDVREGAGTTLRPNRMQMGAVIVDSTQNEVRPDVALISEKETFQPGERANHPGWFTRVESQEGELGGHHIAYLVAVGCGTGPAAVHIGRHVVDFHAILIRHNRAGGGSGIGTKDDTTLEGHARNGGPCFREFGEVGWEGAATGGFERFKESGVP